MQRAASSILIACLLSASALAQSSASPTSASTPTRDRRPSAAETEAILPSQRIGPGDMLSIAVADCPEMTRNFRISSDGTLTLPMLQEKLHAAGKQPDELETEISAALVRDQILVRPVVSVAVVEYRSVPVSVLGAVKKPTTFQAVGYTTLLDAITRAEGLTSDAGSEILVSRPTVIAPNGENLVQHIAVKGLLDDADPALNIRLYGGEEIRVPPAGRVYVFGNVKKSGSFPVTDNNDITVMKVLSLSEGLLPFTNRQAFIYRRQPGQAKRNEIPVPLGEIMNRRSPDVQLEANDILYIPDNHGKRVAAETLERLANFGSSTGSGLLIFK
jgi:polysaccharide export outer membrane protein